MCVPTVGRLNRNFAGLQSEPMHFRSPEFFWFKRGRDPLFRDWRRWD
jgi:hypothetical protein